MNKLQKAVKKQLASDSKAEFFDTLADVREHGAGGGFHGFIYYVDTVAFFKRNRAQIIALLEDMADDFGESIIDIVAGFQTFEDFTPSEMSSLKRQIPVVLYTGKVSDAPESDAPESDATQIANVLAWFALEQVAHDLETTSV